ncbi:transposase [Sinorhizobium meliloti]|nr:transposase [Sinorhizobium meliloti]MDE3878714.1 hypothetical protein [Sinorhizobium meliloti]MDE4604602.1 hypothetical protein [Sinorhizobium meliloti]UDU21162.1 hypothetical protein LJD24_18545 [Sinorhizobium meliloti]
MTFDSHTLAHCDARERRPSATSGQFLASHPVDFRDSLLSLVRDAGNDPF